jgi:hypothetical protein
MKIGGRSLVVKSIRPGFNTALNYSKHITVTDQVLVAYGYKDTAGDLRKNVPSAALNDHVTLMAIKFKQ